MAHLLSCLAGTAALLLIVVVAPYVILRWMEQERSLMRHRLHHWRIMPRLVEELANDPDGSRRLILELYSSELREQLRRAVNEHAKGEPAPGWAMTHFWYDPRKYSRRGRSKPFQLVFEAPIGILHPELKSHEPKSLRRDILRLDELVSHRLSRGAVRVLGPMFAVAMAMFMLAMLFGVE